MRIGHGDSEERLGDGISSPSVAVAAARGSPDQVLAERARKLAEFVEEDAQASQLICIVEFLLGNQAYAVRVENLREVYPLRGVTRIPCVPEHILGVITVRGQILTVLDLKRVLGLHQSELTVFNKVVVIEHKGSCMGFLVDELVGSRLVSADDIQEGLSNLPGSVPLYLMGITSDRTVILDASKIIGDDRLIVQ
jgi:purine-binding chemotaxis protein CheW